jgi:hypothetical protein
MTDKKKNRKDVPSVDTGATLSMGVRDRLIIGMFMPLKADKLEQILARDVLEKTELTQKDIAEFKLVTNREVDPPQITWDEKLGKKKKVRFSNPEVEFLQRQTKRMSDTKDVTLELLGLLERIDDLGKKTDGQEE